MDYLVNLNLDVSESKTLFYSRWQFVSSDLLSLLDHFIWHNIGLLSYMIKYNEHNIIEHYQFYPPSNSVPLLEKN